MANARRVVDHTYEQFDARTWDEAKNALTSFSDDWIFRGHGSDEWALDTSLERHRFHVPSDVAEGRMLTEFQRRAHQFLSDNETPRHTLEWLGLMQHYGAPTRLLDWTRAGTCGSADRRSATSMS